MLNYLIILVTVATGALLLYPKSGKSFAMAGRNYAVGLYYRQWLFSPRSYSGVFVRAICTNCHDCIMPSLLIFFGSAIRFNIARIETCLGIRSFQRNASKQFRHGR